jgi:hypothetical protein
VSAGAEVTEYSKIIVQYWATNDAGNADYCYNELIRRGYKSVAKTQTSSIDDVTKYELAIVIGAQEANPVFRWLADRGYIRKVTEKDDDNPLVQVCTVGTTKIFAAASWSGIGTTKSVEKCLNDYFPPLGSLQVNVHNIYGKNMPGAGTIAVVLYDSNYRKVDARQRSFSGGEGYVPVTFAGIPAGSYIIEVYQTPNSGLRTFGILGRLTSGIKVEAGKTTTFDFYRHTQVLWGVRFEGLTDQKLMLGQSVTPKVTVKNF